MLHGFNFLKLVFLSTIHLFQMPVFLAFLNTVTEFDRGA